MQTLVLGMHRSGTSIVARLLNLMGAYFAPEGFSIGANEENPKGFWERRDVLALNELVLHSIGADWDKLSHFSLDLVKEETRAHFREEAGKIVFAMDAHRPWFLKEPRLCLLAPLWLELLEFPICVLVYRAPLEVARSLQMRNGFSISFGLALWERYNTAALLSTKGQRRIVLNHAALLRDPVATVRWLFESLGAMGVRGLALPSQEEIVAFVDPSLYRARKPKRIRRGELSAAQRKLHTAFESGDVLLSDHSFLCSAETEETLRRRDELLETQNQIAILERRHADTLTELADLKQKVALVEQCNSELTTKLAQSETVTTQLHRAKIEELTEVNHLLQQALHALEQHFQKLRSSRSFHFMVYTARRLGLVSRTPRRCVEAMARQFSETEKALKRATGTSIAARKAKAGAVLSLQNRNRQAISQSPALPKADVVICIHNALEDVRRCLAALVRHATARLNKLILVDDGSSDTETIQYLQQFAQEARVPTLLLQNRQRTGYTMAANRGLAESKAQYVILLNSDTVVTPAWIERLIACGESDPAIGIVGPLSNAASWQSVPERFSANGDWAVNPAPSPCLDRIACAFSTLHSAKYPKVPLVNGFCLAIKRSVINTIGQFNEVLFPEGYGEENDYCLRASKAGFLLAIADDCYVFHAKSKSYSHTTRRNLAAKAQSILHQKYGSELTVATEALKNSSELEKARQAFARLLQTQPCSILFLMNLRGAGGGVTSIVQEANGLRELGASAQVAISSQDEFYYRERFPTIPARLFYVYRNLPELIGYAGAFEFVVATLFTGVSILKMIVDQSPSVGPCYYIQDYEPNFFSASHPRYREALESYTLISNMRCFAKTRWLSETVSCKHGVKVAKVEPSLDREIFFADQSPKPGDPFVVCAMVRPTSEHRSPGLTFEILRQIKLQFGKTVQVQIFGLAQDDIFLDRQPRDFEYSVAGILNREGVARLLRASSLFIDASTYQAFGRTGLEAMACRCATILPGEGGVSEYAVEGVNTLLLARPTVEKVVQTVRRYLEEPELYQRIVDQGLQTASHYSIAKACASELRFFESIRQQLNDETSQGGVAPLTLANASPSIAFA